MSHSEKKSVILVPVGNAIEPQCEQALHFLERTGYEVRRVWGFSAIDFGRCVMASEALRDGFDEIIWIDSDIAFHPNDVAKLRSHNLPLVCGIYPKKSKPEFACDFLPGCKQIVFGKEGALHEIRYAGFGFVYTQRQLYETIRLNMSLPACNARFGKPVIPFFMPMLVPDRQGTWYLAEDYAFCERARQSGFKIMADTTIRLGHVGRHCFSWEDINKSREKLGQLKVNMNWVAATANTVSEPMPIEALQGDAREEPVEISRPRDVQEGAPRAAE